MLAIAAPMLITAALATAPAASSVCPSSDRTTIISRTPAARTLLVPKGAVSLTVCRYNGLENPPSRGARAFVLVASGTTSDRATIARVSAELDAIRPTQGAVAYSCPADFGTKLLAFFVYRGEPGDVVTIGLSGCNAITNGHLRRLGLDASVIGQLAGLAKPLVRTGVPPWKPVPPWEPATNGA